jgi:N-acylneuraminate cytidylyltransferase
MEKKVTAIVPIKEHSERLPRKNFRKFNDRPLYHWILDTLQSVEEVDRVIVNTDAEEVIEEAPKKFEVEISVRPSRLENEEVTTNIIKYEISRTESDIYLHTYCTCPLLTAETISGAIQKFINSEDNDSILPVTKREKRFYNDNFEPVNHKPHNLSRSQDISPLYVDNSVLFIYNRETFEKTGHRIGVNPLPIEIDRMEAIEIDYLSEFEIAEYIHRTRKPKSESDMF